jgi:hypothetical protein
MVTDVSVEPVIVHQTEISSGKARMELIATDAAPGGEVVSAAGVNAGASNIE